MGTAPEDSETRRHAMLRYVIVVSGILILAATTSSQVSSTKLFSLSYGTGQSEVRWKPMSAEGEFDDERPLLFRVLRSGDFLLLSKIADRLLVQIFNRSGQLKSSYTIDRDYTTLADVFVTCEGVVYCLSQFGTDTPEGVDMLQMYDAEGKPISVVADKILLDTFKQLQADFIYPLSLRVESSSGDVFFLVSSENDKSVKHWIRVRSKGDAVEALPIKEGWINKDICGLLIVNSIPEDYSSPIEKVAVSTLDGTAIAEFPIHIDQLSKGSLFFRENVAVSPDRRFIVIEAFGEDSERPDSRFQVRYLGVYDRDGKEVLVLPTTVLGGRMWDMDRNCHLYYLHFTPKSVEVRKINPLVETPQ
jgi:hypothetical protein